MDVNTVTHPPHVLRYTTQNHRISVQLFSNSFLSFSRFKLPALQTVTQCLAVTFNHRRAIETFAFFIFCIGFVKLDEFAEFQLKPAIKSSLMSLSQRALTESVFDFLVFQSSN